jgi:hypothetical protein
MRTLRGRLSWMLAVWLVFQVAGIGAPLLAATGIVLEDACTCPAGVPGATCPMHHSGSPAQAERHDNGTPAHVGHHTNEGAPDDQTNRCAMKNAYPPTDLALLGLSGGAGVLPQLLAFDAVEQAYTRISLQSWHLTSRTELPDSPPPRA